MDLLRAQITTQNLQAVPGDALQHALLHIPDGGFPSFAEPQRERLSVLRTMRLPSKASARVRIKGVN